jgi:hypothetical protein
MMAYYFLLFVIICSSLFFIKDKEGYVLCLTMLFRIIISLLLYKLSIQGLNLTIIYFLNTILIVKLLLQKKFSFTIDASTFFVLILYISIFITNLSAANAWDKQHVNEVNTFQFQLLVNEIIPFIILLVFLNKKSISEIARSIPFYGILLLSLFFLILNWSQLVMTDRMSIASATGINFNSLDLSRYSAIILLCSFVQLMDDGLKRWRKIILFMFVALSSFCLLMAAQRASIIGVVLALMIYSIFTYDKKHIKNILFIIVVFLVGILLYYFNIFNIRSRFEELASFKDFERYYDYSNAWGIFKSNNYMEGVGSHGYEYITGRCYPHNFVLECMVEYGIMGLISSVLILFSSFSLSIKLIKNKRLPSAIKSIPVAWIALFISALFSSNILGNFLFIFFIALMSSINKYYCSSYVKETDYIPGTKFSKH